MPRPFVLLWLGITLLPARLSATLPIQPRPDGQELAARLGCGACHPGIAAPASAGSLEGVLGGDPAAVFARLLDPAPPQAHGAPRMPDFRLTQPEAAALALAIVSGEPGSAGGDGRRFREVVRSSPEITQQAGGRLRTAFGCDACHGGGARALAPPLGAARDRLRAEWLRTYLRSPHDIRPFGWMPGTGSRMPDFRLSAAETDMLVAWLAGTAEGSARPESPSRRAAANTLTLMRDRWGCMGCHAWRGEGGRIGPDLALAGARLRPEAIRAVLTDPARATGSPIMPRPQLPERDLARIVALLAAEAGPPPEPPALSRLEHSTLPQPGDDRGASYLARCAPCHGAAGEGDGYNARYLRAPPTAHADGAAMALRPDDTLYDGIHAGGRILGGSGDMPAFGGSLQPEEIIALVRYIRDLCRCEGPAWSRDGRHP